MKQVPCCKDPWFHQSMETLNGLIGGWGCGTEPLGYYWNIGNPAIHVMGLVAQIFSRNLMIPKNASHLLLTTVIFNGALFAQWCPVALHLAKLIQAETLLLSSLPLLSVDTPPSILQRIVTESRQIEAEGQMLAWPQKTRWTYGILGKELVAEGRSRLRRFRGYVRRPGTWQNPSWKEDLDVQLAHSFHVGLKQCSISGNFSIGDILEGDRQVLMAASPSLWEQGLLSLDLMFQQLQQRLPERPFHYVLAGGTLLALMRHGTGAREIDGVLDFVDKDIDIILVTNTASDWWTAIAAVDELLVYHGWEGCSLSARSIGEMAAELELEQIEEETGIPVHSRGVMELVCGLFGTDSVNRTQRAIVPLNILWLRPFRFKQLVAGRRMYEEVWTSPRPGDVLMSSSACSRFPKHREKGLLCFPLARFPLQSWRGVLSFHSLIPAKACAYLPMSRLVQGLGSDNPDNERTGMATNLPCPPQPVSFLRWYDRGELWGRISGRPCLAMPLVVDHDRVQNDQTRTLKERGLSNAAVREIFERMLILEALGGESLIDEAGNCTYSSDGGYRVSMSTFKGSFTAEADCGPLLDPSKTYPDWSSPRKCPHRIKAYNNLLYSLETKWHPNGYLVKRQGLQLA